MKLARPDIFHPRIVLAGQSSAEAVIDADDGLVAALRGRGLHARWMLWDAAETLRADLVIVRAGTDYRDRLDEFLAWTKRVANLLNPPDVLAWNTGRHYLRDVARAGVPTRLGGRGRPSTALVFLGGTQSHAFTENSAVEVDFELWDVGYAALDAAAGHVGVSATELLYARVDVTGGPGDAQLADLDLVAPVLGWHLLDDAARADAQRQFALAVQSALERLGLGPLSHRRP